MVRDTELTVDEIAELLYAARRALAK